MPPIQYKLHHTFDRAFPLFQGQSSCTVTDAAGHVLFTVPRTRDTIVLMGQKPVLRVTGSGWFARSYHLFANGNEPIGVIRRNNRFLLSRGLALHHPNGHVLLHMRPQRYLKNDYVLSDGVQPCGAITGPTPATSWGNRDYTVVCTRDDLAMLALALVIVYNQEVQQHAPSPIIP